MKSTCSSLTCAAAPCTKPSAGCRSTVAATFHDFFKLGSADGHAVLSSRIESSSVDTEAFLRHCEVIKERFDAHQPSS